MENIRYYKEIVAYLGGKMTAEDARRFEHRLEEDPAVRQELELYQAGVQIAELFGREVLADQLQSLQQRQDRSARRIALRRVLSYAAGFLLVAAVGMGVWANVGLNNVQLVANNYTPPNLSGARGGTNDKLVNQTYQHYLDSNYIEAEALMEIFLDDQDTIPANVGLLAGHIYMKNGKLPQAIDRFEAVVSQSDSRFQDNALWHLSLAHLEQGDEGEAMAVLDSIIAEPDHPYREKALELANQVEHPLRVFCW